MKDLALRIDLLPIEVEPQPAISFIVLQSHVVDEAEVWVFFFEVPDKILKVEEKKMNLSLPSLTK